MQHPRLLLAVACAVTLAGSTSVAQQRLLDINQQSSDRSSSPELFTDAGGWTWFFAAPNRQSGYQLHRTQGTSATTELVLDLGPFAIPPASSTAATLVSAIGRVFFTAWSEDLGRELWVTDGTEAGTYVLADTNAGTSNGDPKHLTELGGTLYFVNAINRLWRTDGTVAGTSEITHVWGDRDLIAWNGELYFTKSATGSVFWDTLWKSDGTLGGTVEVFLAGNLEALAFTPGDTQLFFYAIDRGELWVTDGTTTGTTALASPPAPNLSAEWATLGDLLVFTADNEVWVSDGTVAGTQSIFALEPGVSPPGDMVEWNGKVYFSARDGGNQEQLWVTDGTAGGTAPLTSSLFGFLANNVEDLQVLGNRLYFLGSDTNYWREVWTSDGTVAGTQRVTSLAPEDYGVANYELHGSGTSGLLYFASRSGGLGSELYASDGTPGNEGLVSDLHPGTNDANPEYLATLGPITLFTADDGIHGTELWKTDGTPQGTELVQDIHPTGDSDPRRPMNLGDVVLFQARTDAEGYELWCTDGTAAGTMLLADIFPGTSSSQPTYMTRWGDRVYFAAKESNGAARLWKSDGTVAGTQRVSTTIQHAGPGPLYVFEDELYFSAERFDNGNDLWKLDAAENPTLVQLTPSQLQFCARLDDGFVFHAKHDFIPSELWFSDGTTAGTQLVRNLSGPYVYSFEELEDGRLLFWTADDATGTEFWVTDGTEAGTQLLIDLNPGPASGVNGTLGRVGPWIYFNGSTPDAPFRLWRTDGTVAGTTPIGPEDVSLGTAKVVGQRVLYARGGDESGAELHWVAGGGRVQGKVDLWPGELSSDPTPLSTQGGALLFAATDLDAGRELWILDPVAGIESIGAGCGSTGVEPRLTATTPYLGRTWRTTATGGAPHATAVLFLGDVLAPQVVVGLPCDDVLDPLTSTSLAGFADADGNYERAIPIPWDVSLLGATTAAQVRFGSDRTNGLYATIGLPLRFEEEPSTTPATASSRSPSGL